MGRQRKIAEKIVKINNDSKEKEAFSKAVKAIKRNRLTRAKTLEKERFNEASDSENESKKSILG